MCCLSKVTKWFDSFCSDKSKKCTCWFDGWWSTSCAFHDDDYIHTRTSKVMADLKLWKNVTLANKWLIIPGFVMGFIMFLGLTLSPMSYKFYESYKESNSNV